MLYFIVTIQVAKGRLTTMTESFFGIAMFLAGNYALTDYLVLAAPTADGALLAAKLNMSFLDLSALALVLFTISHHRSPKRSWSTVFPLTIFFLVATWTVMIQGVERSGLGWKVMLRSEFFYAFCGYLFFYVFAGAIHLHAAYRKEREQSRSAGVRAAGVMHSFIFILIAGTILVTVTGGSAAFPVFSILLLVPALATLPLLMPGTWQSWVGAARGGHRHRVEVMAAYLMYEDGTIIQSKSTSPRDSMESDLLPKTLDIVQSFVRTSFPLISGRWLKAIDHGDMRIVVERGEHTCLALVLAGRENELLRRQMRDVLIAFESKNNLNLTDWFSATHDAATGAQEALNYFFARESLF